MKNIQRESLYTKGYSCYLVRQLIRVVKALLSSYKGYLVLNETS